MSLANETSCSSSAGEFAPEGTTFRARAERPAARFSLWEMLLATAVLAIVLAIVRAFGIYGAVACTAAAHLLTWVIYPRLKPGDRFAQEVQYDLTWGLVMPVVFFLVDPMVFKENGTSIWWAVSGARPLAAGSAGSQINAGGCFAYAFAGWQMATLAAWLLLRKRSGRLAAFFTGTMFVGLQLIAVVGVFLLPAAALGLLTFGVGIVFATPAMMAWSLVRSLMDSELVGWRRQPDWQAWALAIGGGALAIAGPAAIGTTIAYIVVTSGA
jgi:hypothetical protein